MDWHLLFAGLALLVSILSVTNSWKSRKNAREANERAERSAAAAERSALSAESFSKINEAIFESGRIRFVLEQRPDWEGPGHWFANQKRGYLVNVGTHAAFDVSWASKSHIVNSPYESMSMMVPGARVPLFYVPQSNDFDTRFSVHYRESENGPCREIELLFHSF